MNERIKKIREILGLSQNEFAKQLGLQRNSISLVENGKRNLSDRTIIDICNTFQVNEDWIRNGGPDEDIFIEFSEDAEIAKFTTDLLMDTDDVIATTIKNFIVLYGKMDENSKQVLRNIHKELFSMTKNEEQT